MPDRNRARFGDLERAVLDVLWGPGPTPRSGEDWLTVRDVHSALGESRSAAYTTVMTVLDRMSAKGLVVREKDARTNRYRAAGSRGEMTAELMRDAMTELVDADHRSALVAFVGEASEEDQAALREALAELERRKRELVLTPAVLAVLAVLLAGPGPWLLGRLPSLRRTPRAAMVLWQSVALAAVLAALGAGVSFATARAMGRHGPTSYVVGAVALVATLTVLGRLLLSGHVVGTRLRRLRRRHRLMLDLLAQTRSESQELRVLHAEAPMAYCLPAITGSRVVLSDTTLERLDDVQLGAVLAHEQAHLRARHDLVLEAFTVLQQAFPALVTSERALAEVRLLVEVLADSAARARYGAEPLVLALSAMIGSSAPDIGLGVASTELRERLEVLLDEEPGPLRSASVYVAAAAVVLLPTALVVVPWVAALVR